MKPGIEYSDKSWNCFTGCEGINTGRCALGMKCWAYKMSLRQAGRNGYDGDNPFRPTFHPDKLDEPLKRKKPTTYNVSFMGDIGYCGIEWLFKIIEVVKQCPQHRFIFLTKEPILLAGKNVQFPDNCIVGVTVNCQKDIWRIANLFDIRCRYRWVSFEPVYSCIMTNLRNIDWIVIGAQSNPDRQPKSAWIIELMRCADYHNIPIFLKPNLHGFHEMMKLPEILRRD